MVKMIDLNAYWQRYVQVRQPENVGEWAEIRNASCRYCPHGYEAHHMIMLAISDREDYTGVMKCGQCAEDFMTKQVVCLGVDIPTDAAWIEG